MVLQRGGLIGGLKTRSDKIKNVKKYHAEIRRVYKSPAAYVGVELVGPKRKKITRG
jgi:hypothetical protein